MGDVPVEDVPLLCVVAVVIEALLVEVPLICDGVVVANVLVVEVPLICVVLTDGEEGLAPDLVDAGPEVNCVLEAAGGLGDAPFVMG